MRVWQMGVLAGMALALFGTVSGMPIPEDLTMAAGMARLFGRLLGGGLLLGALGALVDRVRA